MTELVWIFYCKCRCRSDDKLGFDPLTGSVRLYTLIDIVSIIPFTLRHVKTREQKYLYQYEGVPSLHPYFDLLRFDKKVQHRGE